MAREAVPAIQSRTSVSAISSQTIKNIKTKNGAAVEAEISLGLDAAGKEGGVVCGRAMDFALHDYWVKAVHKNYDFTTKQPNLDHLANYADNYDENPVTRLLEIKSGTPYGVIHGYTDMTFDFFLFALVDEPDVIYVLTPDRLRSISILVSTLLPYEYDSPPWLSALLPYKWTRDTWPRLLQLIASGQLLKHPTAGFETQWHPKSGRFRDDVHVFEMGTHTIAANALLELDRITRPTREEVSYKLRLDFVDFQPLGGDMMLVDDLSGTAKIIQHKSSDNEYHMKQAWRPTERWDFLIWENRSANRICVYSRAGFTPSKAELTAPWTNNIELLELSTADPSNGAIVGHQIIDFMLDQWNAAGSGWAQIVSSMGTLEVAQNLTFTKTREPESSTNVEPNASKSDDPSSAANRSYEKDVQLLALEWKCIHLIRDAYNLEAYLRKKPTRLILLFDERYPLLHPYGDGFIVLLDQNKTSWTDFEIKTWLFSLTPEALAIKCIAVRFCARDITRRQLGLLPFPLDAKWTEIPLTTQPVFFLGYPYFTDYVPARFLFMPSEHVQWPAGISELQRIPTQPEQIVTFETFPASFLSTNFNLIKAKRPELTFWKTLPEVQAMAEKILSDSGLATSPLGSGAYTYSRTFQEMLQATITHGVGRRGRHRREKRSTSLRDVQEAAYRAGVPIYRDGEFITLQTLKEKVEEAKKTDECQQKMQKERQEQAQRLLMRIKVSVLREICSTHEVAQTGTVKELGKRLSIIPGMADQALLAGQRTLSKMEVEDARERFSRDALRDILLKASTG